MTTNRPVFLDLTQIRLPLPGVVSILHRVSGVLMVLALPFFTALFALALSSPEGFSASAAFVGHPVIKLGLVVMAWALLHHLFAGIRYLVIDLGWGVDRLTARKTAWTALSAALVVTLVGATVVGGGLLQ